MATRFVGTDRPRRVAFSPPGKTSVLVNQDNVSDVYIANTEEELMNVPYTVGTGAPKLTGNSFGTKLAANGGQLNWTEYTGQLWALASGGVGADGVATTNIRVLPG